LEEILIEGFSSMTNLKLQMENEKWIFLKAIAASIFQNSRGQRCQQSKSRI
jgi:hypothetical protein